MQTFVPLPSAAESAAALDNQRLGKQRVEAWTILRALSGQTSGWTRHPAVRMWAGHRGGLALYGKLCCLEWLRRGFRDTLLPRFQQALRELPLAERSFPPWWGRADVHASHRAALLAKSPGHYSQFGWTEPAAVSYVWPLEAPPENSKENSHKEPSL